VAAGGGGGGQVLSPRVKPKRTEELRRKIAQDRLSFMERSPYGPGSEYSYFRDLALVGA
jgi:hypothetical protein